MITIPEQHYQQLLQLVQSLSRNFTLLLHNKERGLFEQLLKEFNQVNTQIQQSVKEVLAQSQRQKLALLQYESQLTVLRQKNITQQETIKSQQTQMTRLRQQLAKSEKQTSRLRQISKQLKGDKAEKEQVLSEMQEEFKSQLKAIKKENKQLKERVKQLQTAIITESSQQQDMELDRELEELKKYQQP